MNRHLSEDKNSNQFVTAETDGQGVMRLDLLPAGPGNPRNSEGDFIELADGRILFVYTRFRGGSSDHSAADLAVRFSLDRGRSWSCRDCIVIPNEAEANIMSVSLLRLQDGRIAMFYVQKNSLADCRPVVRFSSDEATSWSDPVKIISDDNIGYYVLNNDRVIQLENGRLLVPLADHRSAEPQQQQNLNRFARILCYFSDDAGETWKHGETAPVTEPADGHRVLLQEPGVVELNDRNILIFCRTDEGSQYTAGSSDHGETWAALAPSNIISPRSPASIKRVPATRDLLMVWNDHSEAGPELKDRRTPLTAAISQDEGVTWRNHRTLADNPDGWYCYTAIAFVDDHVLLGHCAGDRSRGKGKGLADTRITRFPVEYLYR